MTDEHEGAAETDTELDQLAEAEVFAGHGPDNEHLHLTIPELAGAQTLANANAHGSPKARRRAKAMAWILIAAFVLPIVIGLLFGALG